MRAKDFKGRCIKKHLQKADGVVKLYDSIQVAFAEILDIDPTIKKIMVNFYLQDLSEGEFTSDFVCIKVSGDYLVRECVYLKKLTLPRTCRLLDASREYYLLFLSQMVALNICQSKSLKSQS